MMSHGGMIPEVLYEAFGRRASVHLDAAAIATLHSAPTMIVPATGDDEILVVTGGLAVWRPDGATWTFAGTPRVVYNSDLLMSDDGRNASSGFFDLMNQTGDVMMTVVSTGDDGTQPTTLTDSVGQGLYVACRQDDPIPDGDPSGDLYVTVFYAVVDLQGV